MYNVIRLKHALAVRRTGSVTSAARSIGSTQSTITKSLATLEDAVGFALFHRRARGMDVTEKGEEFLTRVSRIVADLDDLQAEMNSDRQERNSLLRLGISPASLQGLHNAAIRTFVTSYPNVRLHMHAISPEHGIGLLQRGDIDLLVGPLEPIRSKGDLEYRSLADVRPRFFVRKDHPLVCYERVKLNDLVSYPIVYPDLTSSQASDLHEALLSQGILQPDRHLHIVDYFPLVTELVENGDMVGIINQEQSEGRRFKDRFEVLPIEFIKPFKLCVAWRKRWEPSSAMRGFLRILRGADIS